MAKIEVKNVYKIFGTDPNDILPMVKEGANKEEVLELRKFYKKGNIYILNGLYKQLYLLLLHLKTLYHNLNYYY